MLATANFRAGRFLGFASGNPATRSSTTCSRIFRATAFAEIARRVQPLCDKYDLPYLTGSLSHQYARHCESSTGWHCRTRPNSPACEGKCRCGAETTGSRR